MSKVLSNGTLSLRFMQNAQRAKQQAQVEAEQAKVKDEAEWEVSQETKDAWGVGSNSEGDPSGVTYETSYVPFLFPHSADDCGDTISQVEPRTSRPPHGRRTFKGGIEEVAPDIKDVIPEIAKSTNPTDQESSEPANKRPKSISGHKLPLPTKAKVSKRTKTAQMLIREDNGKGLSRPPRALPPSVTPQETGTNKATPTGFLKPAGVDMPSISGARGSSSSVSKRGRDGDLSESVGAGSKKRNRKRALE
ncbi:hypothetical protein NLI96_g370 [Meripilus lineatus]|uniref:Uncharacterized protein n=1 Tax=Meripilus lineatus TaxID=2056292 RepID=A0AAD5YJF9_9APHY|nr:hypothetical protein NLI96_g370 [Physisporinus lineatus]